MILIQDKNIYNQKLKNRKITIKKKPYNSRPETLLTLTFILHEHYFSI